MITHDAVIDEVTQRILSVADLDGALWRDCCQIGIEAVDAARWKRIVRKFRQPNNKLLLGDMVEECIRLVATSRTSWGRVVRLTKCHHELLPGVIEFEQLLKAHGVGLVAATHGVADLARPLLDHHGLTAMPLLANWLSWEDGVPSVVFAGNRRIGADKAKLVRRAQELGKSVLFCIGDGQFDIPMARATMQSGGFVLALADSFLHEWCKAKLLPGKHFCSYKDFRDEEMLDFVRPKLERIRQVA